MKNVIFFLHTLQYVQCNSFWPFSFPFSLSLLGEYTHSDILDVCEMAEKHWVDQHSMDFILFFIQSLLLLLDWHGKFSTVLQGIYT